MTTTCNNPTNTWSCHEISQLPPESIVFGGTTEMQALQHRFKKVAALDMPVVIEGESGTGKDILARLLHQRSPWMSGLFVKVRCSSIPDGFEGLLESSTEVAEAESRSISSRPPLGCHGTLFLDEVSEAKPSLQAKLLRLLQEGQFCSINLQRSRMKLRLICSTNCGLEEAAVHGSFRRDLLYRINALTMRVPPLRERTIDIPNLVHHFLNLFCSTYNCKAKAPSAAMLESFVRYSWPGNIRELENWMRRYVVFGCEETVCDELFERSTQQNARKVSSTGAVSLKQLTRNRVRELEREAILKALEANRWNRKRAACDLNISYRSLLYKLKDAGIGSGRASGGSSPANKNEVRSALKRTAGVVLPF